MGKRHVLFARNVIIVLIWTTIVVSMFSISTDKTTALFGIISYTLFVLVTVPSVVSPIRKIVDALIYGTIFLVVTAFLGGIAGAIAATIYVWFMWTQCRGRTSFFY